MQMTKLENRPEVQHMQHKAVHFSRALLKWFEKIAEMTKEFNGAITDYADRNCVCLKEILKSKFKRNRGFKKEKKRLKRI